MNSTNVSSWLSVVNEAFAATDGSRGAVLKWVTGRLGSDSLGAAFTSGVLELARFAACDGEKGDGVNELEEAAIAASRRMVLPLLEAKLQARVTVLDATSVGACACVLCGSSTLSEGLRQRQWMSVMGPLTLRRRYRSCVKCTHGFAHAQKALGLTDSDFTPRLEEVCTLMATTVPFGMATSLVGKLCGIEVSVKAVQDMTERRAENVLAMHLEEAKTCTPFDECGLPKKTQHRPANAVPKSAIPRVAYIEIDGVIPITREEFSSSELTDIERQRQARAKTEKTHGGKGKRFHIVGREVKNAVLYDGKNCATPSVGRGCLLEKTYVSHLGEWQAFAERLWVAMLRLRFDEAELLVVVSDGAEWIRSLANWLPVKVLLILDLFHVKHRVWEVANSLYGAHSSLGTRWANQHCERIENGDAKKVIETLRKLSAPRPDAQELLRQLIKYLENNLDRMDYPAYRKRGLRVGSGAVESANFHVIGARLKLQGMRWSAEGAAQMAVLRAHLFNDQHERRTRQLLVA